MRYAIIFALLFCCSCEHKSLIAGSDVRETWEEKRQDAIFEERATTCALLRCSESAPVLIKPIVQSDGSWLYDGDHQTRPLCPQGYGVVLVDEPVCVAGTIMPAVLFIMGIKATHTTRIQNFYLEGDWPQVVR